MSLVVTIVTGIIGGVVGYYIGAALAEWQWRRRHRK